MDDLSMEQQKCDYLQWFVDHPEFISNPFYVGGDSFSGFIVPEVVQQISLDLSTSAKLQAEKHVLQWAMTSWTGSCCSL
ncbi:PREDICTED: serine carboxypeptidase-like 18 [Camelina sativa]|uniref:Serine carboxypeptidase-like 18 n=1 Tax=Camelina sativa TaxID=90675 RepID=A0ABM0SRU7_CAMSA|nr:PREDICTED: serine carboxypeptidase-like 18 [Camelina sativa]